jgi:hypothetical protein
LPAAGPATARHAGDISHAQQLQQQLLLDANMTAAVPAFSSGSFIPTLPYEPQKTGSSSSSSMTAAAADGVDSCTADPTGSSVKGCDAVSWPVGNPTGDSLAHCDNSSRGTSREDSLVGPVSYAALPTGSTITSPEGRSSEGGAGAAGLYWAAADTEARQPLLRKP